MAVQERSGCARTPVLLPLAGNPLDSKRRFVIDDPKPRRRSMRGADSPTSPPVKRLVVGMSGASGAAYAIRLLEVLRNVGTVETHLVMTQAAKRTVLLETDRAVPDVEALADRVHPVGDIAACVASGSYPTLGMVVIPCSIRSLSGIAHSYSDNLLLRAADVALKDRRPLILVVRETPLHLGHTRLLSQAIEIGAVVMPATPAFYHRPQSIDDLVDQFVNRVLDQLGIELDKDLFERWQGSRHREKTTIV